MKPDRKGFTLFEVLISIFLSSALAATAGSVLVFGHKSLTRIIDINRGASDIMIFRSHIEARIQKITGQGFLLPPANIVPNADVDFIQWRECNPEHPPLAPNGLPNFNKASIVRVSNWTNLVATKIVFNSVDPNTGALIRCIYEYLPNTQEIEYREYTAPVDPNGQESQLTAADPTAPAKLRVRGIILRGITVFQIGRSSSGLPDWELYGTRNDAANAITNADDSGRIVNSISDAYVRVFVRTKNEDVRYRTNKSFLSRSTRRELNCWTMAGKTTSWEFDPTLMEFFGN